MIRKDKANSKMEQLEQQEKPTIEQLTEARNLSGGLQILVELAEKGEIDPWDIDIIKVTDKYLAALNSTPRENLLNAGRAIFFASVLLRLKSDILLNLSNETLLQSQQTEDFFPEDQLLDEDESARIDLSRLESFLVRSSIGKQQRKRKIILSDLISALQQAEEEEERRVLRKKLRAERLIHNIAPIDTPDDLLELAHEEDIEEYTEKIEAIIEEHLTDEKPITLSFLTEILGNKFTAFVSLMFLQHSNKLVLEQKEFYGEVIIYKAGAIIEEPQEELKLEEKPKKKSKKKAEKTIENNNKEVESETLENISESTTNETEETNEIQTEDKEKEAES